MLLESAPWTTSCASPSSNPVKLALLLSLPADVPGRPWRAGLGCRDGFWEAKAVRRSWPGWSTVRRVRRNLSSASTLLALMDSTTQSGVTMGGRVLLDLPRQKQQRRS